MRAKQGCEKRQWQNFSCLVARVRGLVTEDGKSRGCELSVGRSIRMTATHASLSNVLSLGASSFYSIIIEYLLMKYLPLGRKGDSFCQGFFFF
jgi:hypothetical protein